MRTLKSPSEKLIYLYLFFSQPQSFMSIRRGLRLSSKTVAKSLKKLRELGYVKQDLNFLYWLTEV
jgi:predicted transcriptional regulator